LNATGLLLEAEGPGLRMVNPESAMESPLPMAVALRARELSDLRLAQRLSEDPHGAAPQLYDRFASDVNRWVWRLMGADADHNDVVQQVFVRVLRTARRLRDPERMVPWIHSITVNTVYGELRRREVRRIFLRHHDPAPPHADFVREVEVRDLLVRAKRIIQKLPTKERIVFLLHHVEGRTLHEVAELCGYSHTTAKRTLGDAHRRFAVLAAKHPELTRAPMHKKERTDERPSAAG
jgi:RNA polymerase sigma-70 factor, ECF subfamily